MAAREVYSLPMLLLVGWRGEPGKRDEPQHLLQGHSTPGLLGSLLFLFMKI
jgi:phosphonopyruvate decarboxylase